MCRHRHQVGIPVLEEPEARVFNLCRTVNCILVYGITMSKAGTFPRQKPCNMTELRKSNTETFPKKKLTGNYQKIARTQALYNTLISPTAFWYPLKVNRNQLRITTERSELGGRLNKK